MEIKIPKEVRQHKETIFFGLTVRQFICSALAVGMAVGVYLGLGPFIGKETASWACIVAAAPLALAGFFSYNGMTFEKFAWAFVKSQFLCAGPRVFRAEGIYSARITRRINRAMFCGSAVRREQNGMKSKILRSNIYRKAMKGGRDDA